MNNTSTHAMPVCITESPGCNTFIITSIAAFVNVCTTSLTITFTMARVHNKLHSLWCILPMKSDSCALRGGRVRSTHHPSSIVRVISSWVIILVPWHTEAHPQVINPGLSNTLPWIPDLLLVTRHMWCWSPKIKESSWTMSDDYTTASWGQLTM